MSNALPAGTENLEIMDVATIYNAHIARMISGCFPPGSRLIDFGAGHGVFAEMMRKRGATVICIEPEAGAQSILRAKGFEVFASLDDVPQAADGLYTINVLEHIPDDIAVIRQFHHLLPEGAPVFAYVPAFQVLFNSMDETVGHVRRYRRRDLLEKFSAQRFDVRWCRYVDSLGFLATWIWNWKNKRFLSLDEKHVKFYDQYIFPISKGLDVFCHDLFGKNVALCAVNSRDD